MRKHVLTLTLNQSRKVLSSFHIREMEIIWSFEILSKKELHKLLLVFKMTTSSRGKSGRAAPAPQSQSCTGINIFASDPVVNQPSFRHLIILMFWWPTITGFFTVTFFFKSFLPTQTYTTFTMKTFKGQFTTKVRTCSLKYLPTHCWNKGCFAKSPLEFWW